MDFYGDKDSNFLTRQLFTAAVWCRGGAASVKLSCSCRFTDGGLRAVYGDCRIVFYSPLLPAPFIELTNLIFCGLNLENVDSVCVCACVWMWCVWNPGAGISQRDREKMVVAFSLTFLTTATHRRKLVFLLWGQTQIRVNIAALYLSTALQVCWCCVIKVQNDLVA